MSSINCENHKNGVDIDTPSRAACSESLRGACKALRRPSSSRKIGAACNMFAEYAIERAEHSVVPKCVAPRHNGKARPEGPQGRRSRPAGTRQNYFLVGASQTRPNELKRNGKAKPACHIPYVEARRAKGQGTKSRGKILGMVILWGNGMFYADLL